MARWASTSATATRDASGFRRGIAAHRHYSPRTGGGAGRVAKRAPGMSSRLTAEFWIGAYLARLRLADIPAFVIARGDATAGAVVVKINTLDGQARAFARSTDTTGARVWTEIAAGPEPDVDAALSRQRRYDPDLWIVEVEDRAGRTLLDEPGLAD